MQMFTEEELQKHEKALEDYPDAMPKYETIVRYISNIRALSKQVEILTEKLLEVESAKNEIKQ